MSQITQRRNSDVFKDPNLLRVTLRTKRPVTYNESPLQSQLDDGQPHEQSQAFSENFSVTSQAQDWVPQRENQAPKRKISPPAKHSITSQQAAKQDVFTIQTMQQRPSELPQLQQLYPDEQEQLDPLISKKPRGRQPDDPVLFSLVMKYANKQDTLSKQEYFKLQAIDTHLQCCEYTDFIKRLQNYNRKPRRKQDASSETTANKVAKTMALSSESSIMSASQVARIKRVETLDFAVVLAQAFLILEKPHQLDKDDVQYLRVLIESINRKEDQQAIGFAAFRTYKPKFQAQFWQAYREKQEKVDLAHFKKTLSAADIVSVFFWAQSNTDLVDRQLETALSFIDAILAGMTAECINTIELTNDSQKLFSRWNDRDSFVKINRLSLNMLHFMARAKSIRTTLRTSVLKDAFSNKQEQSNAEQGLITIALSKFFQTQLKINHQVVKMIIENPDELLWDDLIQVIAQSEDQSACATLVLRCHKSKLGNPSTVMRQIEHLVGRIIWIYQTLVDQAKSHDMTLEDIKEVLEFVQLWERVRIERAIKDHTIKNLIANSTAQVATSNILKQEQKSQLDLLADQLASKDNKILEIYQQLVVVSIKWQTDGQNYYQHRAILCYIAAKALASDKYAVYLQLDPGNGKTFVNLLICYHLSQIQHKPAIYITLNRSLQRAVRDKMKLIGITGFEVIDEANLFEHIGTEVRFVYDEYYAGLISAKLDSEQTGVINPIFLLGHKFPIIMSTGHNSDEMKTFLLRFFGQANLDLQIHRSIVGLAGEQQKYELTVQAFKEEDYINEGLSYIKQQCQTRPVIYFGPRFVNHEMFGLSQKSLVRYVDKDDDDMLQTVQLEAPDHQRGVIGLDVHYGVGVDIRFSEDALVVIIQKDLPNSEDCRQMISRGVRSFGTQEGVLFCQGNASQNRAFKTMLLNGRGTSFEDGARVIKTVYSVLKSLFTNYQKKEMMDKLKGKWRINKETMMEGQDGKVKEKMKTFWVVPKSFV